MMISVEDHDNLEVFFADNNMEVCCTRSGEDFYEWMDFDGDEDEKAENEEFYFEIREHWTFFRENIPGFESFSSPDPAYFMIWNDRTLCQVCPQSYTIEFLFKIESIEDIKQYFRLITTNLDKPENIAPDLKQIQYTFAAKLLFRTVKTSVYHMANRPDEDRKYTEPRFKKALDNLKQFVYNHGA